MIFGMIEFGRAIMVKQILTNASREGARQAVLDSQTPTASTVKSNVATYLTNAVIPGSTSSDVTIDAIDVNGAHTTEPTLGAYGTPVTVTVQVPYSRVSWLPTPKFFGSITLKAITVMRRETVQ